MQWVETWTAHGTDPYGKEALIKVGLVELNGDVAVAVQVDDQEALVLRGNQLAQHQLQLRLAEIEALQANPPDPNR